MPDTRKVTASIKENVAYMNQVLPVEESFDIVQREMTVGGREASFYFINGFVNDESMLKIMDSLFGVKAENMPGSVTAFVKECIPYVEVNVIGDFDQVFRNLLSGTACFLWTDMKPVSLSIAGAIRREVWTNRIKISHCVVPEMDLLKRLYLTQLL